MIDLLIAFGLIIDTLSNIDVCIFIILVRANIATIFGIIINK